MTDKIPGADLPIWGAYLRALAREPVRTKCITSFLMLTLTQVHSQMIRIGRIDEINKVRDFGLWGLCLPLAMHPYQNLIAKHGPQNLLLKLVVDHISWRIPFVFLFGMYNKLMEGSSLQDAWAHCLRTQPGIQRTSLKLWPVLSIPHFTIVPVSLRVLYQNICIYFWTLYLATRMRRENEAQHTIKQQ